MPKSSFIDFKAVKAVVTMEQLLQHYGLLDQFKRSGDNLSGPCPIHKGSNPTQFRISLSKNLWNCFSECKEGGNALDFIAKMENVSIHAAALRAIEWLGLDTETVTTTSKREGKRPNHEGQEEASSEQKSALQPKPDSPQKDGPNKPLGFRLEKLNQTHAYLQERGLTPETIAEFGIGYCAKGMMAGRIAIPIQNAEGKVVAYAGRIPVEPSGDIAKYKLPQGFRKSLELFNIHRATKEPVDIPLIIVEGFFDSMRLYQLGCRKVVALMGSTMSQAQEDLIRSCSTQKSMAVLMLDEDEAGQAGRDDIAVRLAKFLFVKIHVFSKENMQPDQLSAEEIKDSIGGGS